MKITTFTFISLCVLLLGAGACRTKPSETATGDASVLIQLYEDVAIPSLEKNFSQYDLQMDRVVSRPTKIYLFNFNATKISDIQLIEQLKASSLVKEAQQNRNVESRKNN